MNIIVQSYSTIGVRPSNEDAMELVNNLNGANKNQIKILYNGIFDGHGGGEISKTLVDPTKIHLSKYFCNTSSPIATNLSSKKTFNKNMIIPLFKRVQDKLKNYYINSNTMGSTAVIVLLYPRNTDKQDKLALKVINLGDSRASICNEYNIGTSLSLDHKPHLLCEKNRIAKMGGTIEYSNGDDPRINGMSVSRSFGDLDNRYISQEPDCYDYTLGHEKFIVLGCDGIWDVLHNQEVVDFILERYEELKKSNKPFVELKGRSENNIAQKLADYAIKRGSSDNISVSIIFFADEM